MNQPIRIQRKRTKGWKIPANTVSVTRGTKWGNPYKIDTIMDREAVLKAYRDHLKFMMDQGILDPTELKGKNLACWCKVGDPCHADVLLKIANT